MAEQNPIKYSDLISPDDSIEKLIGQLETLMKVYNDLADEVKTDAAQIAASLKTVSGATEQGKQATKGATQETDRLAKAYKDLAFARSETAMKIEELKQKQKEEKYYTKLITEQNRAATGSYNDLSAQYRLNKIAINNLTKAQREHSPAAKKLIEETRQIYEEMNKMQQETGKFSLNVGNYTNAINDAIGVNSKWFKTLQQLGGLFAGGFTSGIKTAGEAVAGFGKKLLALLANPIVATIAAITAAFMALSKGISTSEENTMALERVLAPFQRVLTGVLNILQKVAGWVLKFAEGFEQAAFAVSRFLERIPVVGGYIKDANDAIKNNVDLVKAEQALALKERENIKTRATLERNIAKYRQQAEKTNDPKRRLQLLKIANATEERLMLDEISLAREDLRIKTAKAKMADNDAKANDELAQATARLAKAEESYYQRTTRLQSKMRNIGNSMVGKGGETGKSTTVNDAENEAKELERIQKQKDARELAAMRQAQDAKVELIDNEYDRMRAETIYKYDRQIEDTKQKMAELGEDEVETKKYYDDLIIALEQRKWDKLADIADKEMEQAVKAETEDANKRIKKAKGLIKENKNEHVDLYDMLGFKLTEEQKKGLDEALDYAINSLNSFMDAWVQAAEARRQQADSEVERVQRVLEAEIEARNAGYANDVETARKELDEARKNQQKALQQQRQAQQAQLALDTAMQASSLITATANIWKAFTGTGPWGVALAIAATALMWGSFAAAKIKAYEAVGASTETYGEGTVELLQGGSHQSGNDIDLGRKKDGTRRRAEGGEYFAVINKKSSRKYRDIIPDIINSLNRDTFAEKYMGAYDAAGVSVTVNGRNPDLKELTQSVNDIRDQGRTRTYSDGRKTVEIYKNLKRTVKDGN